MDSTLADLSRELVHARFSRTLPAVRALLARDDLTARQRNQALEILAVTQVVLGDPTSDQTLIELYRRDPGHRLSNPDLGPSVQAAFSRARERASERVDVALGEARIEADDEGGSPFVTVTIEEGADAIDAVVLSYRDESTGFTRLTLHRATPTDARARLPVLRGGELEYFVEAQAPSGTILGRLGTADEPRVADLPEPPEDRVEPLALDVAPATADDDGGGLLSEWWFWSAVGLVVGGAVAGYVLLGPPSQGPDPGSLGQGALE